MKTIVIILSSFFITTPLISQDLRDHLVGEYIGVLTNTNSSTGKIDTATQNFKLYLYKSFTSDSIILDRNELGGITSRFVIHPDTSFSLSYNDNGKPFPEKSVHGFRLTNDSVYYQSYFSNGAGGNGITIQKFYGKKTDWIGVDEIKLVDEISLYPNPFIHELNIKSTQEIKQVIVRNLEGKTQLSQSPKQKAFKLPLSQLNNGVYFIELHTGNGIVLKKVLKK